MSAPSDIEDHSTQKDVLNSIHNRIAELQRWKIRSGTTGPDEQVCRLCIDSVTFVNRLARLYALLIGVDKYASESIRDLVGAVADAEKVQAFLRAQTPPISGERLELLTNEQATASKIIHRIRRLRTNESIRRGDPILIYYAGHGSMIPKPDGWPSAESHMQCLSPHDARVSGRTVEGVVLDVTFGALLQALAKEKGNNITVILDCCHSGSGTREDDRVPRGLEFKTEDGETDLTVDVSYQKDIWDSDDAARGLFLLPQFANSGLQSHIVLSACGPTQSAFENSRTHEGHFTSAFLRTIEESGMGTTMTYSELMDRLETKPLPWQTPQCEGRDKDTRLLFDKGVVQRNRPCYSIFRDGLTYTLDAGEVHGVSKDASFAVYANRHAFTSGGPSFGELVVDKAHPVTSSLLPVEGLVWSLPEDVSDAVAVMTRAGSRSAFRVHIDTGKYPKLHVAVEALAKEVCEPTNRDYSWISLAITSKEEAQVSLELTADDTDVVFEILDEQIRALGLQRLNGTVPCDESSLRSALRSAAHFFYHLRSSPQEVNLGLAVSARVRVLRKSVELQSGIPMPVYLPVGDSTCVQNDKVFYPEMPRHRRGRGMHRTLYAVDVFNKSPKGGYSLFAWMFYFDCSTLEISSYYEPPTGDVKPPLPAAMEHAIPLNFGDAGARPLTFSLPAGQSIDVGFIRIFVSTHNSDLSGIAQKSVIEQCRAAVTENPSDWTYQPEMWGAVTIPVVQR
ncbi:hypothetical protein PENSPDRAFT_679412 [Peniophora sp. CONT]|nr:hypothetical protein PENSPDRAFT_679412 [Peniophora sp. CONT]